MSKKGKALIGVLVVLLASLVVWAVRTVPTPPADPGKPQTVMKYDGNTIKELGNWPCVENRRILLSTYRALSAIAVQKGDPLQFFRKGQILYMDDYDESAVPPWAMRLRLEPEEFGRKEKRERSGEQI